MSNRKYAMFLVILSILPVKNACSDFPPPATYGGLKCVGATPWTLNTATSTSMDASSAYGICADPGIQYWERTIGHCDNGWCWQSCTVWGYAQNCTRTVEQHSVSAEEAAVCDQVFNNQKSELDAWLAICRGGATMDCILGCAIFGFTGPGYGICFAACEAGTLAACQAAYAYDMAALEHQRSDCKFDCVVSEFVYTNWTAGCIG